MDQGNRSASFHPVDPTKFSDTPLGVPRPKVATDITPQMGTQVAYDNGIQASPIGVAILIL